MLQYLAQGACQALEDAVCLADRVEEAGTNVEVAFAAYEALRAPRNSSLSWI